MQPSSDPDILVLELCAQDFDVDQLDVRLVFGLVHLSRAVLPDGVIGLVVAGCGFDVRHLARFGFVDGLLGLLFGLLGVAFGLLFRLFAAKKKDKFA